MSFTEEVKALENERSEAIAEATEVPDVLKMPAKSSLSVKLPKSNGSPGTGKYVLMIVLS